MVSRNLRMAVVRSLVARVVLRGGREIWEIPLKFEKFKFPLNFEISVKF